MDELDKVNHDEFEQGKKDCMDGVVHRSGNSLSYDNGYSHQYELEQKANANEHH